MLSLRRNKIIKIEPSTINQYEASDVDGNTKQQSEKHGAPINSETKGFLEVACELARQSIFPEVSQIVGVQRQWRKIIKFIILVFCIAGFIYQLVHFSDIYFTYPTRVEIEKKYDPKIPLPTLTFCNNNGFERELFCNDYPSYCIAPDDTKEFCLEYPHYCSYFRENETIKAIISDILSTVRHLLLNYSQKPEDLIEHSCYNGRMIKNMLLSRISKSIYKPDTAQGRICYSVDYNSFSNSELYTNTTEKEINCSWWTPDEELPILVNVLNVQSNKYSHPETSPGIHISVTSPNRLINPFTYGFRASPGKKYIVQLNVVQNILLPSPYWTNCTKNELLARNYSREYCIRKCYNKLTSEECNCTYDAEFETNSIEICDSISYNRRHAVIEYHSSSERNCSEEVEYEICYNICPEPCKSTTFNYVIREKEISNPIKTLNPEQKDLKFFSNDNESILNLLLRQSINLAVKDRVVLIVFYESKEVIQFKYSEVFNFSQIVGMIGGFSGSWLGLSLIVVLDVLENLLVLMCYWIRSIYS